jgi:L-galactose dehydrogenase
MQIEDIATYVPGFHDEAAVRRMPYRKLGNRLVSQLSLGCSSLAGVFHGANEDEAIEVVVSAVKQGVNILDTAPWYGHGKSELILGKALKKIPRKSVYVHTKVGRYNPNVKEMFNFTYDRVMKSVSESMERMGIDYIDTVQVHDPEFAPTIDIIIQQTLPALDELRKQGKIHYVGITGYPLSILRELAEKTTIKVDTCISYSRFNMHDRGLVSNGTAAFLESHGIGVINAAPVSMGLLTHRAPPVWHPASAELKALCASAAAYCESKNVDLPRIAMAYCLAEPSLATTMVSTASLVRLQENIDVTTGVNGLTPHEKEVMNEVMDKFFLSIPSGQEHWEGKEVNAYWVKLGKQYVMEDLYKTTN